jgi:hypothetical protein
VSQFFAGKLWVSATPDDLGSVTATGFALAPTIYLELVGNPTSLLQELEAPGVHAHMLGSSLYQGTPVTGYSVTLPAQAVANHLSGLPASLRGSVTAGSSAEDVYLTTNGLIRAIVVPVTIGSTGATAAGHVEVVFSAWGTSADLAPPPPNQVVEWAQFRNALTYAASLKK